MSSFLHRARAARRWFLSTTIAISLFFTTGCNPPPPPTAADIAAREMRIVIIGPAAADPQWPAILGGAKQAARGYSSARLDIRTPADTSQRALDDEVDAALKLEPHAVCLSVADPPIASDAAGRVINAGVPLVTFGAALDVKGVYAHIEWQLAEAAGKLGETLEQLAGTGRNYVLFHRDGASPSDRLCYLRFRLAANEHYSLNQLQEVNFAASSTDGHDEIREAISLFPSTAFVVTLSPAPWLGDRNPRGVLGPDAKFATTLAVPALWPALGRGDALALAGPIDGDIGRYAVELAVAGITNSRPPGRLATVDCEIVTRENVEIFSRRYLSAAGM